MTNLNLYKFFCCVAEEKNISKASEKLFVSQPAVSFSIKELEKEVGQKLFVRKSKGVELTLFGKILYDNVKGAIDKFDEVETLSQRFGKIEQGIVRIGASSSNMNQVLLKFLSQFARLYPNIQISMERGTKEQLIAELNNNALDIIFVDNGGYVCKFNQIKKFEVTYQLIGNKKYKQKFSSENLDMKNFPIEELMLPSKNNNSRITIDSFFAKRGIKLLPKYELDNYILLFEFVKQGFGMAFVNKEYYKNAINSGEVEIIFPKFSICARQIVCLTNKNSLNPALDKLVEIIEKS